MRVGVAGIATHAVLAQGFDVWAAGEGKPDLPDAWFEHRGYTNTLELADWYQQQGNNQMASGWRAEAEIRRPVHPMPAVQHTKTVLLDFQSGHYRPRGAWRMTLEAWTRIGYTVKKRPDSDWTT